MKPVAMAGRPGRPVSKKEAIYYDCIMANMILYGRRQMIEVMDSVLLIQLFREIIISWAARNDDMAVGFFRCAINFDFDLDRYLCNISNIPYTLQLIYLDCYILL